jgi:hypothetical protein
VLALAPHLDWLLADRTLALLREGCAHGINVECLTLGRRGNRDDRLLAHAELCRLNVRWCTGLANQLIDRHELDRARQVAELACEAGKSVDACELLAFAYLRRTLPEPTPGRGQLLMRRSCKVTADMFSSSNELEHARTFARCLESWR